MPTSFPLAINGKIGEPIDVLVAFKDMKPEPMMFKWGKRYYQVQKVRLVHAERFGREKVYFFSVSDTADNAYRLSFRTESMTWRLEDINTRL